MNNSTRFEYDYQKIIEEYGGVESHPLVLRIGLITMIAYVLIFCFGVPANIYVLFRLRKFAKEDKQKYEKGAGLFLFVMTSSDLFSLLAISLQHFITSMSIWVSEVAKSITCKVINIFIQIDAGT